MKTKNCIICHADKIITDFYKNSKSKDGYEGKCKECNKTLSKISAQKNKEKVKENHKNWVFKNKDKENNRIKEWQLKNKEKVKENYKNWISKNKEKIKEYRLLNKENRQIKDKYRKSIDSVYRISCNVRGLTNKAFKRNGFTKNSRTREILGCTFDFLKEYIESKFESWMNWENYGKYNGELNHGWDIDHIIPISSAKTEDDVIKLSHYNNLQPLCSKVNRDIKKATTN